MGNEIKVYKKLTHIELKDGRILTTDKTPEEVYKWLDAHSHILVNGEMHSKFSIINAIPVSLDEVEGFIKMQTNEIQEKMREKRKWLKQNLGKDMTLSYAQNYLANLIANNGNEKQK